MTASESPIAPTIPPVEHLREQLNRVQTEAALLRAQIRLSLRRDRMAAKLQQPAQEGTPHAH